MVTSGTCFALLSTGIDLFNEGRAGNVHVSAIAMIALVAWLCQAAPPGFEPGTFCLPVDERYTIAQWLAHLPSKQKIPGSNPGCAA